MATLEIAEAAGGLGVTVGHRAGRARRRWGEGRASVRSETTLPSGKVVRAQPHNPR